MVLRKMALKADVDQGWDVDKDGNGILTTTSSTTNNNYYFRTTANILRVISWWQLKQWFRLWMMMMETWKWLAPSKDRLSSVLKRRLFCPGCRTGRRRCPCHACHQHMYIMFIITLWLPSLSDPMRCICCGCHHDNAHMTVMWLPSSS